MKKNDFLKEYSISNSTFRKSGLKWKELVTIHDSFCDDLDQYESIAKFFAEELRKFSKVHTVSYRIKSPEHLIEKIIRKRAENPDREITLQNYQTEITDLIGLRILHLYKHDWNEIHNQIVTKWELKETPVANVRAGDSIEAYQENHCEINEHKNGYRSVHYLPISKPTKNEYSAEIQVRTIFEEAWSEVDHDLKYPSNEADPLIIQYLKIFNRLAGSADEMATYIKRLDNHLILTKQKHTEERANAISKLRDLEEKIQKLKIKQAEKDEMIKDLKSAKENQRNLFGFPDINFSELTNNIQQPVETFGIAMQDYVEQAKRRARSNSPSVFKIRGIGDYTNEV